MYGLQLSLSRFPHYRKGFTLVELSIVLVIIGLLIGGLLVGQSMISSAKISSQVAQIGQFDAGVMSFKTKYNYLPGDAPAFGGDGDGVIDTGTPYVINYIAIFACEIGRFWNSLDSNQFPGSTLCLNGSNISPQISGASKNSPAPKIGKPESFIIASAISTSYASEIANPTVQNFYAIINASSYDGNWRRFTTTTSSNSSIKPIDLLSLDSKIDDSLANSGIIISGSIGNYSSSNGAINSTPLATCSSGTTYQVQNTGYECTPLIRIGGSVGEPQ